MSENNNVETRNEIDIFAVIKNILTVIGRGITSLCKIIFLFVKKYFLLLIILFCIALIGAVLTNNFSKSFYKSKMLASANVVNRKIIMDKFSDLQDLIDDKNYVLLAQKLNISEKKAILLKSVRPLKYNIKWEQDSGLGQDFKILQIDVEVWDYTVIPDLEVAFKYFINNDPFIKDDVTQVQEANVQMQKALEDQILQLQQLQQVTVTQMKNTEVQKGQFVIVNKEPVKSFHQEIVQLNQDLQKLKGKYVSNEPLKVIQSLNMYKSPVSVFWKYFLIYIVVLWTGGILAGVTLDAKRKR